MQSLENEQHKSRLQLFFIISLGAYFFWFSQMNPPPVQLEDSVEVPIESTKDSESVTSVNEVKPAPVEQKELNKVQPQEKFIKQDIFDITVTSKYGSPQNVGLQKFTILPTIESWWGWIISGMEDSWTPYSGGEDQLKLLTKDGVLLVIGEGENSYQDVFNISEISAEKIVTTAKTNDVTIVQNYTFPTVDSGVESNIIDIDIEITNHSSETLDNLWIGTYDRMDAGESRFTNSSRPQFYVEEELVGTFGTMFSTSFLDLEDLEEPTTFSTEPEWFGIGSRYFLSALKKEKKGTFKSVSTHILEEGVYGVRSDLIQTFKSGETKTIRLRAFVGPKQISELEILGESWAQSVEYGIFGFFSRPLLFFLKVIQSGFVNWGLSILLLTLVIKVVFFPLTQKAFLSGKKMQALNPLIKELKEKYKDNPQLQGQETMKLFSKHNVSPLGGCLPTFIQIPVWFALYNVMLYSVELYHSSFLYLQDLTSVDPFGILPIMYCVLMFIQQRMMPMGSMDPAQQKMLKMMPLIFGIFMFTFPSGLVLYFSMNILLTIFQQWLIRVQYDDTTLLQEA